MPLVILSGSTGYIGAQFKGVLKSRNIEVVEIIRHNNGLMLSTPQESYSLFPGDKRDFVSNLKQTEILGVVHLANAFYPNHTSEDIPKMIRANVETGLLMADIAVALDTKFVHASSLWAYRDEDVFPITDLYSVTKKMLIYSLDFFQRQKGLALAELVLPGVFGPADTRNKLIPQLISSISSNQEMNLSHPEALVELVFVQDVCNILIEMLEFDQVKPSLNRIFLRAKRTLMVKEIVALIESICQKKIEVHYNSNPMTGSFFTNTPFSPTENTRFADTDIEIGLRSCFDNFLKKK